MPAYAIDELRQLLTRVAAPYKASNPILQYLCALVAELSYYHIPQQEIDRRHRAQLIPCEVYRMLFARGIATNLLQYLQTLEYLRVFAVADRGAVAVGICYQKLLFVGFRGTRFLYDWKVNLSAGASFVRLHPRLHRSLFCDYPRYGYFHSGFAEEAFRISIKVSDKIKTCCGADIEHVFLCGHSLGGAVAAIADHYLDVAQSTVCIYGAPRYAGLAAYQSQLENLPLQVRRPGDIVPTVPPKAFGYIDHPWEIGTDGKDYIDPFPYSWLFGDMVRWAGFFLRRFTPHSIEAYRKALGNAAGASAYKDDLAPYDRL